MWKNAHKSINDSKSVTFFDIRLNSKPITKYRPTWHFVFHPSVDSSAFHLISVLTVIAVFSSLYWSQSVKSCFLYWKQILIISHRNKLLFQFAWQIAGMPWNFFTFSNIIWYQYLNNRQNQPLDIITRQADKPHGRREWDVLRLYLKSSFPQSTLYTLCPFSIDTGPVFIYFKLLFLHEIRHIQDKLKFFFKKWTIFKLFSANI